jgi:hypothetical protein
VKLARNDGTRYSERGRLNPSFRVELLDVPP